MLNNYSNYWNELTHFKRIVICVASLCLFLLFVLFFFIPTKTRSVVVENSIELQSDNLIHENALDSEIEITIEKLLSQMSLEQKVAQMILLPFSDKSGHVSEKFIGAFTLNSGTLVESKRFQSQLLDSINDAKINAKEKSLPYIPPLIGIQAHHGVALNKKAVVFPQAINLGAAGDEQLIKEITKASIEQANVFGAKWLRTISTTAILDQRSILTESIFSEDVKLNQRLSSVHFQTLNENNRIFEANNWMSSSINSQYKPIFPNSNREALLKYLTFNQIQAINNGASFVHLSKNNFDDLDRNGNSKAINKIKGSLNFQGIVVSSSNVTSQLKGCLFTLCEKVINAGVDMIAFESDVWDLEVLNGATSESLLFDDHRLKAYIKNTVEAVEDNRIKIERINDAVSRILRVKLEHGLFETDFEFMQKLEKSKIKEHEAIAREAVIKSAVLLKNQHQTLPIKQGEKVLLIGHAADQAYLQQGFDAVQTHNYRKNSIKKTLLKNKNTTWLEPQFLDPMYVINALETNVQEELRFGMKRVNRALSKLPFKFSMDRFSNRDIQDGILSYNQVLTEYVSSFDKVIIVLSEPIFLGYRTPEPQSFEEVDELTHLNFSLMNDYHPELLENLESSSAKVVVLMLNSRGLYAPKVFNYADSVVSLFRPGTQIDGLLDLLFTDENNNIVRDFTAKSPVSWPKYPCDFQNIKGFKGYDPFFDVGYGLSYQNDLTDYSAWPIQIESHNSCVLHGVRAL